MGGVPWPHAGSPPRIQNQGGIKGSDIAPLWAEVEMGPEVIPPSPHTTATCGAHLPSSPQRAVGVLEGL